MIGGPQSGLFTKKIDEDQVLPPHLRAFGDVSGFTPNCSPKVKIYEKEGNDARLIECSGMFSVYTELLPQSKKRRGASTTPAQILGHI